jgi:RNA polymerase sigma-70 factor (ECF subfamily)
MTIATEAVWARMKAGLLAFFRRRVGDEHLAEDLLQETFLRIHDGLAGLEDEERLAPWVFRIARRTLADHARSSRGEPLAETEELAQPEPDAQNLNREVEGWLAEMAAQLPPEYRQAVELAELEGLTQAEVAQHLGLSLSGAKSRVQRGRARLREVLLGCCHLDFDRRGNVIGYERRGRCSCTEG